MQGPHNTHCSRILAQFSIPAYSGSMDSLAADRSRMVKLLSTLNAADGARPSLVEGVTLLRATRNSQPVPVLYEPCIVIVAQGQKRFHLPDQVLTYDARNFLLLTVPVPADCETTVSPEGPFLGVAVRIDLAILSDLLMKLDASARSPQPKQREARVSAPPMNLLLSNATVRLLECLRSPADAKVLGPQLVRELLYRVLCGEGGCLLRDLLLVNENRTQIHRILQRMHINYAAPLDVSALAREAGMSVSALHFHFKAVTASSPVQYLKTIRLHKARMMMVQESIGASLAAERVGYDSASQFSREFKRLFGAPPAEEAQKIRVAFGFTEEVSVAS